MARRPVALVSSEPIRPAMAGIGLRYLELARRLPALSGRPVRLVSPAAEADALAALGDDRPAEVAQEVEVRTFRAGALAEILDGCAGAVAQGQLANDVLLECPELPTAIDLYDPWLVENLHYVEELGLDPYRNDHATWVLQMSRGDFFLCSSEEQRTFYLGFLAALGRVNPRRVAADPDLSGLVAPVPFGVPAELPPHRPWLPARDAGEAGDADGAPGGRRHRLLFGGLYDWYDPWTLLDAVERLPAAALPCTLYFIANPNRDSTPQRLLSEVEAECRRRGWWGDGPSTTGERRVELLDWVPGDRRYDLLRDVDVMVAPHHPSLETRLSLRTRFLDAAAAGCPSVTTEGGAMSRLLEHHRAGWTVPPGDADALAAALAAALTDPQAVAHRRRGAAELTAAFAWPRVLAPLAEWCRRPTADATREDFAWRPGTVAPPDGLVFRVRRFLRRHFSGLRLEIRTGDDAGRAP